MNLHKRALSLLLSLALVFSIFGLDTVSAYAAQDGSPAILYLDSGDIVFDGANVKQNGQSVTPCPQDSGYLITQHDSSVPLRHTAAPMVRASAVRVSVAARVARGAT